MGKDTYLRESYYAQDDIEFDSENGAKLVNGASLSGFVEVYFLYKTIDSARNSAKNRLPKTKNVEDLNFPSLYSVVITCSCTTPHVTKESCKPKKHSTSLTLRLRSSADLSLTVTGKCMTLFSTFFFFDAALEVKNFADFRRVWTSKEAIISYQLKGSVYTVHTHDSSAPLYTIKTNGRIIRNPATMACSATAIFLRLTNSKLVTSIIFQFRQSKCKGMTSDMSYDRVGFRKLHSCSPAFTCSCSTRMMHHSDRRISSINGRAMKP